MRQCWVHVLSVQLLEGTRRGLSLLPSRPRSFCPRHPEDQDRPGSDALSWVGVCLRPPSLLPAGVPAPLPAPSWARPRACVTAGPG